MNIYEYMNSIPDNVSNPLTAINVMIMISSLKDKFGDKIYETTRKGYLTTQDMIPYKYYKLYLWYWCDECTYGIRECTVKDFNIKEEEKMDALKMSKEDALKAIDNLKKYVEKCEEKEKEIPEMPRHGNYNVHIMMSNKPHYPYNSWERSFENEKSSDLYCILSFELANLIYVRNYLGVKNEDIWAARTKALTVFCVGYHPGENEYGIIEIQPLMALRPHELIWCFTDNLEAQRVCDYMNRYVKDIKRQMF